MVSGLVGKVGETDLPTPRNDSAVCDAVQLAGVA